MFGGQQPILVLSKYNYLQSKEQLTIILLRLRSKHKKRIGPQSAVGEYSSRKGMSVCVQCL